MKCIVLAGGSGDRLWPLSRKNYPKQFIHIKENRSLFQETIARNIPFCEEFYIITSNRYANIVEGQLQVFQGLRYRCFYEEEGKKTAPAVAIACLCDNRSEDYLVVSTDHMIEGGDYKGAIAKGREYIPQGKIVCLGIPAWRFEPGYGYFRQVEERTEFRHSDMTEEIPAGEKWYYDTGILLFNGGDFLHELSRKSPALYAQIRECVDQLDTYAQSIQFPDQMTLGTSSDIRITRHQSNTVNTDCKNSRLKTQSCTGKCCFAACMTGAYYYGIHIFFYNWHMILPYLPIQNLLKISLTRSSPTDSPVILPNDSYASIRSME